MIFRRLQKHRAENGSWLDQVKERLCRIVQQRRQLITIFKFDSERHHGNLEDAILEALFNGWKLIFESIFIEKFVFSDKVLRRDSQ